MVSGMTDDIIFHKSHICVKSKKGYIIVLTNSLMTLETVMVTVMS